MQAGLRICAAGSIIIRPCLAHFYHIFSSFFCVIKTELIIIIIIIKTELTLSPVPSSQADRGVEVSKNMTKMSQTRPYILPGGAKFSD